MRRTLCLLLLLTLPSLLAAQKPLGNEFQVNDPAEVFAAQPHLAANASGEFVVTWIGQASGDSFPTLYARRFAADGRPATGAIRVSSGHVFASYLAGARTGVAIQADGSFAVVFTKDPGRGFGPVLRLRWYRPDGAPDAETVVTREPVNVLSVAARGDGGMVLAWVNPNPSNLWVGSFGPDHAPEGPAVRVQQYASSPAVAASPNGDFVVAWQGFDSSSQSLFIGARSFASDGSSRGEIRVANPVYADASVGTASVVYAGMDGDGNFLIAWAENSAQQNDPTFARRYRPDGTPLGGAIRLDLGGKGFLPGSLAMGGRGNFVLTWAQPGSQGGGDAIFARRFAADGSPLGPVLQVNPAAPGGRSSDQVAIGADGGFVVAWDSTEEGRDQIFARRFQRR
jgi:hypothetical protein